MRWHEISWDEMEWHGMALNDMHEYFVEDTTLTDQKVHSKDTNMLLTLT